MASLSCHVQIGLCIFLDGNGSRRQEELTAYADWQSAQREQQCRLQPKLVVEEDQLIQWGQAKGPKEVNRQEY